MNTIWKRIYEPFIPGAKLFQPLRTTCVVARTEDAPLRKSHKFPSLRRRHFVYKTLQDNSPRMESISILLTKYVDNAGKAGEVVTLKEKTARLLLLKQFAVYPTKENLVKYGTASNAEEEFSSKFVKTTLEIFSEFTLNVSMNKHNPWTLEPWHIRCAFRKAHVIVPESAITMPKNPITGPDMSIQGKEFYVTVTINKKEKCIVRCRINHWSSVEGERLPWVYLPWKYPAETIFPEDKAIQQKLPKIIPPVLTEEDEKRSKPPIKNVPKIHQKITL